MTDGNKRASDTSCHRAGIASQLSPLTRSSPEGCSSLTQRVPKSMRHWFEKHGIYSTWKRHKLIMLRTRKARFIEGTRDRVRHFRVLPHLDRMDICDGYFDRWANSMGSSVPLPRTEAEFVAALDALVKKSRSRVRETWPECVSDGSPTGRDAQRLDAEGTTARSDEVGDA